MFLSLAACTIASPINRPTVNSREEILNGHGQSKGNQEGLSDEAIIGIVVPIGLYFFDQLLRAIRANWEACMVALQVGWEGFVSLKTNVKNSTVVLRGVWNNVAQWATWKDFEGALRDGWLGFRTLQPVLEDFMIRPRR
ncbi:hypothetical protein E8E13_008199 [Curvularia kusanoi]|uniref:Uncharacterized protein n=1 Tax=Curvularia kusanoi TaxID=90978 RepID=A0A9P4WBY5_CURKU|nr:hypothetical protein E8E13_008199 [Curvularia kusanoi]